MDKGELLHKVSVYSSNTLLSIKASDADKRTKELVSEIAEETSAVLAAIIEELAHS